MRWLPPLDWLGLGLLLGYGLRVLADYRRYLNDNFSNPERLRFAGLRQLLLVQAAVLTLNLVFLALNTILDFSYDAAWNFYALQGLLIYGLVAIGIQANYAAASSSLLFGASPQPAYYAATPRRRADAPGFARAGQYPGAGRCGATA